MQLGQLSSLTDRQSTSPTQTMVTMAYSCWVWLTGIHSNIASASSNWSDLHTAHWGGTMIVSIIVKLLVPFTSKYALETQRHSLFYSELKSSLYKTQTIIINNLYYTLHLIAAWGSYYVPTWSQVVLQWTERTQSVCNIEAAMVP